MKTQHLSRPVEREQRHNRQVSCHGYARKDGLLDIEGELIDTKAYDFPSSTHGIITSGTPVHHMQVRITIDFEMVIQHAEAVTVNGPYAVCPKGQKTSLALSALKSDLAGSEKFRLPSAGQRAVPILLN